ncbi:hypothetical protein [Roseinatronobacter sp. NSM]|uniref:hypothetical protein n=1 Tax=Roseinatronobacter sp. NSM TaxID=3457785 RepID=UPI0040372E40
MFKFLFGKSAKEPEVIIRETQRETVERALKEMNDILTALSPRAAVTVDMQHGTVSIQLPEQMPDEAKALPAPAPASDDTAQIPQGDTPALDTDAPRAPTQ